MKNAAIYARYSSHSQTEMSIEGQIAECRRYAEEHDIYDNSIDVHEKSPSQKFYR